METRHKQSETTPQEFCPSCVCRVTSLKTHGLSFCPISMIANPGLEGVKQRKDQGQWPVSLKLQHPCVFRCYCQFHKCSLAPVSLETLDHRQCLLRTPTLLPQSSIDTLNYIPSLLVGTLFILTMQFLRTGFYELGRTRRKWELLNQPLSDNGPYYLPP